MLQIRHYDTNTGHTYNVTDLRPNREQHRLTCQVNSLNACAHEAHALYYLDKVDGRKLRGKATPNGSTA